MLHMFWTGFICLMLMPHNVQGESLPDIVSKLKSSIAVVAAPYIDDARRLKQASSFVLDRPSTEEAILATCRHVFFDTTMDGSLVPIADTSKIVVFFENDPFSKIKASIVACDSYRDIVILSVVHEKLDSLRIGKVKIVKWQELREGDLIASTGYDFGQRSSQLGKNFFWTSTHSGIISSIRWSSIDENLRKITKVQADLMTNIGSSGSAVYLANDGRVLGMIQGYVKVTDTSGVYNSGLANIVPIQYVLATYYRGVVLIRDSVQDGGQD